MQQEEVEKEITPPPRHPSFYRADSSADRRETILDSTTRSLGDHECIERLMRKYGLSIRKLRSFVTRTASQTSTLKQGLKISLHDFATLKRCREYEHLDQTIFIPCKELCNYLINAEAPVAAHSSSTL